MGKKRKTADLDAAEGATKKKKSSKQLPDLPPIKDAELERAVFTHQGVIGNAGDVAASYERLEILGDAIIERIATFLIFRRFPKIRAGTISQLRERLVKNETLAEYATRYGFDGRVNAPLSHREEPKRWTKIKGDVFEAYVAAVVLSDGDHGEKLVEEWLTKLWLPKLSDVQPEEPNLMSKEILAKMIMGRGIKIRYNEEKPMLQYEPGLRRYFIGAYLTGWGWQNQHLGSGQGGSKTIAGNEAARSALANPLTEEISRIKRKFDEKLAAGRGQEPKSGIAIRSIQEEI